MAKTLTTKQSGFEREPAAKILAMPEAGVNELADMVAFLNDDDNREIVSKWNKSMKEIKNTIKEHVSIEDIAGGLRIQFGEAGEVVLAPQKYAAREVKTPEKQIMRMTIVASNG